MHVIDRTKASQILGCTYASVTYMVQVGKLVPINFGDLLSKGVDIDSSVSIPMLFDEKDIKRYASARNITKGNKHA